jgi:hypothetical protein
MGQLRRKRRGQILVSGKETICPGSCSGIVQANYGDSMELIRQDNTFEVYPPEAQGARRLLAEVARQAEGTTTRNTLNVYGSPVLLEVHDSYFHHDSAVMMPDVEGETERDATLPAHFEDPEGMAGVQKAHLDSYQRFAIEPFDPGTQEGEGDRVSGLGLLVAAYRFQNLNPGYHLLLAGHADTSGDFEYNFVLSQLRAANVLYLLLGERGPWVDICIQKSKVEDHQRILKHYAQVFDWDCDPGPIDNELTPGTTQAVRSFQSNYNTQFAKSISVDGVVGRETWGAIFDCYMEELASMMDLSVDQLPSVRNVQFLDPGSKFIACGEKKPIDQPNRENFRSKENRRVEFLFFRAPFVPDLSCHAGTKPFCMKTCQLAECGVYGPDRFDFIFLKPQLLLGRMAGDYQPQFRISASQEDLDELHDRPDGSYQSEMRTSVVAENDPWGFLEPFADLQPQEGSDEQHRDPFGSGGSGGRGGRGGVIV